MRFKPGFRTFLLLVGLLLVACRSSGNPPEPVWPTPTQSVPLKATASSHPGWSPPTAYPEQPTTTGGRSDHPVNDTPQPSKIELPVIQSAFQVGVCSPLAGITLDELPAIISSPYDPPPTGKEDRHHGVDFSYYRRGEQSSIQGTGVQSILPGVVAMALTDSFPYGNVVIVESDPAILPTRVQEELDIGTGESLYSLFAHLEEAPEVQAGQEVAACQRLGAVGKSGNAGVAHLHLETRLGLAGVSFYQMGYYLAQVTELERENYLRWRISADFRHFDPMMLLSQQNSP